MSSESTIGAQSLVDALRQYQALIPHFTQLSNAQIIAMRRAATLHPDWVYTAINAIDASPAVQAVLGSTAGELRDEIADLNRWGGVEQELRVMLKGVAAANLIRQHRVGLKVLQAYGIARQLVRQEEHKDLVPFVQKLKQMNKLGRRKPKAEKTPAG